MILLDTSVLSHSFRRRRKGIREHAAAAELRSLILNDEPCAVPGIVLQEILSGVKSPRQFTRLQALLDGFPILLAEERHHEEAARIASACARRGIALGVVDGLIAALAVTERAALFTTDSEFERIAPICGLTLFRVGVGP